MADITMCPGVACPMKEECYRYMATASQFRQSYWVVSPIINGKCEEHIPYRKTFND